MIFDADPNFTHKFPVLWLVVCFRILSLSPRGCTLWIQHAKATRLPCWTLVSDVSSSFPPSHDRPWTHIWDSCHITMSLAWTAIRTDAWSFVRIQDHRRRFHCYLKTFFSIFVSKVWSQISMLRPSIRIIMNFAAMHWGPTVQRRCDDALTGVVGLIWWLSKSGNIIAV